MDIASGEDDFVDLSEKLLEKPADTIPCENCAEAFKLSQLILREVTESRNIEKVRFIYLILDSVRQYVCVFVCFKTSRYTFLFMSIRVKIL